MKIINITAIIVCISALVYSVEAFDDTSTDKLSEIMKRGSIIIAIAIDYPPMSDLIKGAKRSENTKCLSNEYTSSEVMGFEIDVAKEVAKRLKVDPCFVSFEWGEIVSGRWAGRMDIAICSVSITSERMKSLYFAQPYSSEPAVFYVHKNNTRFKHIADLSGQKIGTCAGCIFEYYLEGTMELPYESTEYLVKKSDIIAYDTEINSIKDLSLGDGVKLDAVLIDIFLGRKALSDGMPIKQLGEPVFYSYVAPAIDKKQKGNPIPFIKKINEIIMQLHHDGVLNNLSSTYYKIDLDNITPAKQFDIQSLGQYP
ncbi:MAG: transporter substrate-binding domain-containing protein [Desulfobacterales bacterium]|nr:transporter substrate-binding domain-containing protein [Desulfobacterales bacterium]